MPLDVPSAILQRRSIKNFKPDAIAPELLNQIIKLTIAAPSSFNLQDWRIIIVQDQAQRAALAAACFNHPSKITLNKDKSKTPPFGWLCARSTSIQSERLISHHYVLTLVLDIIMFTMSLFRLLRLAHSHIHLLVVPRLNAYSSKTVWNGKS